MVLTDLFSYCQIESEFKQPQLIDSLESRMKKVQQEQQESTYEGMLKQGQNKSIVMYSTYLGDPVH